VILQLWREFRIIASRFETDIKREKASKRPKTHLREIQMKDNKMCNQNNAFVKKKRTSKKMKTRRGNRMERLRLSGIPLLHGNDGEKAES